MTRFVQQVFNILTSPPGNLIYHLILVFSIAAALQAVLAAHKSSSKKPIGRVVVGLCVLLLGQILLFATSGLAWQNIADPRIFLPPLDRALAVLSLVWIIWMWIFPQPVRLADIGNGLLNLIIVILFLFTLVTWAKSDPAVAFNLSDLDISWGILCIFIALAGLALFLVEQPEGWGVGVGIAALHLAGYLAQLLLNNPVGNLSAALRLAQICAYPMLPILAQQLYPVSETEAQPRLKTKPQSEPFVERRRYSAEPRAAYSWLNLAAQNTPESIYAALTQAVSQTLLADLCLLIRKTQTPQELLLQAGYDLVQEEQLPGNIRFASSLLPAISNALENGRALRIEPNQQMLEDCDNLVEILGLKKSGNLLFIPIRRTRKPNAGLLLLSPYSQRVWKTEDETYLTSTNESLSDVLERAEQLEENQDKILSLQNELDTAHMQLSSSATSAAPLNSFSAGAPAAQPGETSDDLESFITLQKETQQIIQKLKDENERLILELEDNASQSSIRTNSDIQQLENELRLALEELAFLKNTLADVNLKIVQLEKEKEASGRLPQVSQNVINTLAQDLRQPLASIVGYTDLLLSENTGILGAVQRSFLERIRTSLENMQAVLRDLALNGELREPLTSTANLSEAADEALSYAGEQIREKRIALQVNIPQNAPQVLADRDTLQQILNNLLANAVTATPFEGTVWLNVCPQNIEGLHFALIEVIDSGGGIEAQDLPRVFARRYRGSGPVIHGVGDNGIGLTIAQTLAESLNGRIWVNSKMGQGAIFSVLLPAAPQPAAVQDSAA